MTCPVLDENEQLKQKIAKLEREISDLKEQLREGLLVSNNNLKKE